VVGDGLALAQVGAMTKLIMLAALTLGFGACGGGDLDSLTKLKDEACACKDKACAQAVNKKMDDTLTKMKEPSADQVKKLESVMEEAGKCLAKYM
jgi:hypothetical protein